MIFIQVLEALNIDYSYISLDNDDEEINSCPDTWKEALALEKAEKGKEDEK